MAQLSPAVRAAGVDAAIVEQEEGVHAAAGHVPQPPAAEHVAPPGLKGGVRLPGDAQLPILGVAPAQHVGQVAVRKRGEHLSERAVRAMQPTRQEDQKRGSGLTAAPLSPLHVSADPGRRARKEGVSDSICLVLSSLSRTVGMLLRDGS